MSKTQMFRSGFLLLALAGLVFYKFSDYSERAAQDELFRDRAAQFAIDAKHREALREPANVHGIGRNVWVAPPSNWLRGESELAKQSLENTDIELLIVPVQGDKNAFDPVERSLITRMISQSVADETEFAVANPSAVLRYLGTNRSQFPTANVAELARYTGAKAVMTLTAEHDRNSRWTLEATKHDPQIGKVLATKSWQNLSFSPENPPIESVVAIIDQIAEFASGSGSKVSPRRAAFDPAKFSFPVSLDELGAISKESRLYAVAYLQLVAMLHPGGEFNEVRNQLFERSYIELTKVSPESDYYQYFKARALAYLGRRPAAVEVLGEPANKYEKALLAALNGNLPNLKEFAETSGTSPLDFMAIKDMRVVEWRYHFKVENGYVERFVSDNLVWAPFIYRSLMDVNGEKQWANYSTITAKLGLEGLVPVDGDSVEAYLEAKAVTGDYPDEVDLVRLLWRHVDAIMSEQNLHQIGDLRYHTQLSQVDVAELAKTIAVANHLQEIVEDLDQRALPEVALANIAEFDPIFSGHPEIALLKGRALAMQADDATGAEKQNLRRAATDAKLQGFHWSGSLTRGAVEVAREYGSLLRQRSIQIEQQRYSAFSMYSRRYFEWPRGEAWFRRISRSEADNNAITECLNVTWVAFYCLEWQIEREARSSSEPDVVRNDWLTRFSNRFAGNPWRAEFEVKVVRMSGDEDGEIRLLRERVEAQSEAWNIYKALGLHHKMRGEYEEAQSVWLSYPGFREDDGSVTVGDSQFADFASSQLYWIGQYELATPILEVAARSGTGSSGAMSSAERLALINGDLDAARYWSSERVRRYKSEYGARDLLQLLHIMGEDDTAWTLFDELQQHDQDQNSEIWSGALVGHRMSSTSMESLAKWVEESESRKKAIDLRRTREGRAGRVDLAPRYLLLAGTMDRLPNDELYALVAGAFSRQKPQYRIRKSRHTDAAGTLDAQGYAQVSDHGVSIGHDPLLPYPANEQYLEQDTEVDFRYTMLARSITAFLEGDHKTSYDSFNRTAHLYYLEEYLPYFAFSAAKMGQQERLIELVEARRTAHEKDGKRQKTDGEEQGAFFDEYLALAVLAAFDKKHEDAIRYLELALNDRPFLAGRSVYPMYQVVDLADRLYEQSGKQRYRELALELSRRHTVVLPMYAWAYFVVAKHSEARVERMKATASGLYLDPLSERGRQLPKDLLEEANNLLEEHGPPFLRRSEKDLPQAT